MTCLQRIGIAMRGGGAALRCPPGRHASGWTGGSFGLSNTATAFFDGVKNFPDRIKIIEPD